jgi:hypothetical protein
MSLRHRLERYFEFAQLSANWRTEILMVRPLRLQGTAASVQQSEMASAYEAHLQAA